MSAKNIKIVTVIATFHASPGQEQALREALVALVAPTRQEEGCLNYDLHVYQDEPGKFLFHENWISRAHLDAHLASTHIQALLPHVDHLCVTRPEITLWEKIA
jgi:quinol monooxygenase YgiN